MPTKPVVIAAVLAAWPSLCGVSSAAQTPAGWQAYRSPDYGFTLSYPQSIKLYPQHARGEGPGGYAPVCSDTAVACFGYTGNEYAGTNFEGAGIAVNVLRDAKTEKACNALGSAEYPQPATQSETIRGRLFHYGEVGEAGMSHYQAGRAYRALYQSVCFEIETQVDTVSLGVFDPGTIKSFDPAKLKQLFDEVLHTFEFVGPVKDGPDWKVSRDSGCGGTFEYPADATLRVTAENIYDPPGSNRITCSRSFSYRGRDYTLAIKDGTGSQGGLDAWLKSSGYSGLGDAEVVNKSQQYTDYRAGPYYYVYVPGQIFIFSVSDTAGHVIDPGDDPVYSHWLASFKVR